MLVVTWHNIIVRIAVVGYQIATFSITVELDLGRVNLINWD